MKAIAALSPSCDSIPDMAKLPQPMTIAPKARTVLAPMRSVSRPANGMTAVITRSRKLTAAANCVRSQPNSASNGFIHTEYASDEAE